ncbi:nucleotide sugar dehydrogenase [Geodermatophilus amargosae]|uniref:nucleotide sugar dehydrogenase n=1 Tax=Geodermatophilus amargosae TaxID=1296565 RepID=UPI0015874353|nr:nucleotide sugar dehydrogenase [Geodermatophilus amargosae]
MLGLGRVGLAVAAALASHGGRVCGVDIDPRRVAMVAGHLPADDEPGLAELLGQHRFSACSSHADGIRRTSVTYVIVPTPSDDRGGYELRHVQRSFEQIGHALAQSDEPHTVVLASTVLPGATRYALQPVLEDASGRAVGDGLDLCYSPPFVALGSVLRDFLHPDFALLGVADGATGREVETVYRRVLGPGVPIRTMSIENAELTKLAVNTFLTMKITFANTLAALCDHLPGGDVDTVTDAVGSDSRVGPQLLTGGFGYGGPCLPRDNAALALLAEVVGVPPELARATDAADRWFSAHRAEALVARLRPESTAVILGAAYKAGTSVVDASQSLELARVLAAAGVHVVVYDQRAASAAGRVLAAAVAAGTVRIVDEPADLPRSPDLVVIATTDAQLTDLALDLRPALLADPWRLVTRERWPAGTEVLQYGRPNATRPDDAAFNAVRSLWADRSESPERIGPGGTGMDALVAED